MYYSIVASLQLSPFSLLPLSTFVPVLYLLHVLLKKNSFLTTTLGDLWARLLGMAVP